MKTLKKFLHAIKKNNNKNENHTVFINFYINMKRFFFGCGRILSFKLDEFSCLY
jgi:hypothetical protein